jgi:predicted component of type VI protein secretion system
MDEAVSKWFMDTAAKKWKDYKTNLKNKYFDETLTDEQMKERLKSILNDDDINELIQFWRSPECQVRNSSYESLFSITCL